MRHVFLSYRRDDTQYITGFICRELTAPTGFGPDSVFMDIDGIPPGVDFREVIEETVTQCRFFLVVIGRHWITVRDADDQPRLQNPNDWVRLEMEAALRRGIPVVPVLVEGARMPKPTELPESLHPLLYKNATTIRPGALQFADDVKELVKGLHRAEEWMRRKATPPSQKPPLIDSQEETYLPASQLPITHRITVAPTERELEDFSSHLLLASDHVSASSTGGKEAPTQVSPGAEEIDEATARLLRTAAEELLRRDVVTYARLARVDAGVRSFVTENGLERFRVWLEAAERGNPAAMTLVGDAYEQGAGATQDYGEAVRWHRNAAELGNVMAMHRLAQAYHSGRGVEVNLTAAVKWYRAAAELDYPPAVTTLGEVYNLGHGVPQDSVEAVRLFRTAAGLGHPTAMCNLGIAFQSGRGVIVNHEEALIWYHKAVEGGNAAAMFHLGRAYAQGNGVGQSHPTAVGFYRRAAELGHPPATNSLGNALAQGKDVAQDLVEAVQCYRKAAELGHSPAMINLGTVYSKGMGVERDHGEAVKWFRRAAESGSPVAMNNLGSAHEYGRGVKKRREEAISWYRKAAKLGNKNAKEALKRLGVSEED